MSNTNIPLPSEGVVGGRNNDTATATCFCGAVQLLFVRETPAIEVSRCKLTRQCTANQSTWPGRHFRLQLHRLQEDHRQHVRQQLHRLSFRDQTRPWPRQAHQVRAEQDHRERQYYGEPLLIGVWDANVSHFIWAPGALDHEDWDG